MHNATNFKKFLIDLNGAKKGIESEIMLLDDCRNMLIATKNFYIMILEYYHVVDNCFRILMSINT